MFKKTHTWTSWLTEYFITFNYGNSSINNKRKKHLFCSLLPKNSLHVAVVERQNKRKYKKKAPVCHVDGIDSTTVDGTLNVFELNSK